MTFTRLLQPSKTDSSASQLTITQPDWHLVGNTTIGWFTTVGQFPSFPHFYEDEILRPPVRLGWVVVWPLGTFWTSCGQVCEEFLDCRHINDSNDPPPHQTWIQNHLDISLDPAQPNDTTDGPEADWCNRVGLPQEIIRWHTVESDIINPLTLTVSNMRQTVCVMQSAR